MTRSSSRRTRGIWAGALLIAAALLGGILMWGSGTTAIDQWWHSRVTDLRQPLLVEISHGLNTVGGGVLGVYVVPLVIGLVLLFLRGWRTAAWAIAVFALSALAVQAVKQVVGRSRPEDLMVAADYGSFPSGHTANAATIAVVLWVVFPRLGVMLLGAGWILLMAFSRTVLAAHWLTDTIGGVLLGLGVGLLATALTPLSWQNDARTDHGRFRG